MMNNLRILFLLLCLTSCYRVPDQINPRIDYQVQDRHFAGLASAFSLLNANEKSTDWGREMIIAKAFAEELDLYRAISTYKRAEILVPPENPSRKLEIQYDILLCYFLAKRYDEAVCEFDKTGLANVDKTFPAYHDLLLILYECYRELDLPEKEERILELMQKSYPETAEKVQISCALRTGDLPKVESYADGFPHRSYLDDLLDCYRQQKKSVAAAQTLNALLPGAGYFYIGQRTSAFTALLLNSLFIVAAYEFFHHGHTAAGIITTLFESGWYFGGIYGVGLEAKYYNERIYERNASCVLNTRNLFPALMIQYGF
jgi:tetratricopeptide (TPR) repeat protein